MKVMMVVTAFLFSSGVGAQHYSEVDRMSFSEFERIDRSFAFLTFERAIFAVESEGQPSFERKMEHNVGAGYGWLMVVDSVLPVVFLREVLTLPARSPDWEVSENTEILEDGKIAVTELVMPANEGIVHNSWGLSAGDPKGKYKIEVFYKDTLVYSVTFEVE